MPCGTLPTVAPRPRTCMATGRFAAPGDSKSKGRRFESFTAHCECPASQRFSSLPCPLNQQWSNRGATRRPQYPITSSPSKGRTRRGGKDCVGGGRRCHRMCPRVRPNPGGREPSSVALVTPRVSRSVCWCVTGWHCRRAANAVILGSCSSSQSSGSRPGGTASSSRTTSATRATPDGRPAIRGPFSLPWPCARAA